MVGFSLPVFALSFFAIAAVAFIVVSVRRRRIVREARAKVLGGNWIQVQDLAASFMDKNGKYQQEDGPGCYIILVFDHEVTDGDFGDYREVYVGKAAKAYEGACSRIAQMAPEKGTLVNDDGSCYTYVQARFYDEKQLKSKEHTLADLMKRKR